MVNIFIDAHLLMMYNDKSIVAILKTTIDNGETTKGNNSTMSNENPNSYNGWSNYETWCVNLWIDNEEGSQSFWRERAQDACQNATADYNWETDKQAAIRQLADELKDQIENDANDLVGNAGMFTDLLNSAIGSVD